MSSFRLRRLIVVLIILLVAAFPLAHAELETPPKAIETQVSSVKEARQQLTLLAVKGRAAKTGYERKQFGNGWDSSLGCDMRNNILRRDLRDEVSNEKCKVMSGVLDDPYTGRTINFIRGETTSDDVQIDHVIALSNAWQTGAQQFSYERRVAFANDPLNLLAVDGPTNEKKSDGDAATWLPPNKNFRCEYVKRQTNVKSKYKLWVTVAEKQAMMRILERC